MYTIRRSGDFDAVLGPVPRCSPVAPGENPEGGNVRQLHYDSWVTVEDEGLDESGFVIDAADLQEIASLLGHEVTVSCEVLARKVAQHLWTKLGKRKEFCTEICVRIYGTGGRYAVDNQWAYAEHKLDLVKARKSKNGKKSSFTVLTDAQGTAIRAGLR